MAIDKIKCKYVFEEDYNTKYVNGAQGGINLQGEIIINFYLERHALPKSQTFEIEPGGRIGKEIFEAAEPSDLKQSFVRHFQSGIILNYNAAKEIHNWLGNHLKGLEELNDAGKKV